MMSLTSLSFPVLVCGCAAGYYLVPRQYQWCWLLLFSGLYYYSAAGSKACLFLLFTIAATYTAGRKIPGAKHPKAVMLLCLLADFGVLAILKYTNFLIFNINAVTGADLPMHHLLLPLGISFYTFQSVGYLLDVYWERIEPERNFLRFALFVSFFPQLLQGPISRFQALSSSLFAEHRFEYDGFMNGLQLILWGYFKKLVLADRAGVAVKVIFQNHTEYHGFLPVLAVLLYSVQLYMDFSGGMDVVMGVAELFGISLTPNFRRPYFAVSIADFWRRWHITLGTWMKDYVFYPLSFSRWMGRWGKRARKWFGKQAGRKLPICLANILIFLIVGLWHGPAWHFLAYGLYNGLLIAGASLLEPVSRKVLAFFHIPDRSLGWKIFRILRTFLLVNISWFLDMAADVPTAWHMFRSIFHNFTWRIVADGSLASLGLSKLDWAILAIGIAVVFLIGLLQERGISVRESLASKPVLLRWSVYLLLLFAIPLFGYVTELPGGFLYAQF